MQTWEAIQSRRNVRVFADRPIPAADLDQVLEAGRRSPSSQNWQPWDFILVTDRGQLRELAKVWTGAGHVAGSAATIVVIGPAAGNEFRRAQFDLGQATMAMTLAAASLGIGSCHAGVAGMRLARDLPGFPGDRDWAFPISLGYPAGRPLAPVKNPGRRPFGEVVHRGRWQAALMNGLRYLPCQAAAASDLYLEPTSRNASHVSVTGEYRPRRSCVISIAVIAIDPRRLADLGATLTVVRSQDGVDAYAVWVKDPEGNEFDIS